MIKECLSDTILIILMVATVISLPCGYYQSGGPIGMVDGFSIFIAIFIIVCITVGNEKVKQKQFQELEAKSDTAEVIVLRNGIKETIDANDLVVGDVVYLELGKAVPADCIVF
jgi:magnesium-transporting ATPase (P-type)